MSTQHSAGTVEAQRRQRSRVKSRQRSRVRSRVKSRVRSTQRSRTYIKESWVTSTTGGNCWRPVGGGEDEEKEKGKSRWRETRR